MLSPPPFLPLARILVSVLWLVMKQYRASIHLSAQEIEDLRAQLAAKTGHVSALEAQLDELAQVSAHMHTHACTYAHMPVCCMKGWQCESLSVRVKSC